MAKKKEIALLGVLAAIVVGVVGSKLLKTKSKDKSIKAQGIVLHSETKYKEALEIFLMLEQKDFDVLSKISDCYYKLGSLTDSLIYLNKAIKMCMNRNLLDRRYEIHKSLAMDFEAFKDLFLLNKVFNDQKYSETSSNLLKKIAADRTKAHKISGWASKINFSDFFHIASFLEGKEDPAVLFINSMEYEKCYDFIKESEIPFHKFLLGCFYFVNGEYKKAVSIFENLNDNLHSNIILNLIRARKLSEKEKSFLRELIDSENDPTILYYMCKIFDVLEDTESQNKCIQKLLNEHPSSTSTCLKIISLLRDERNNNIPEAADLISAGLKLYPADIGLTCIALEFYISVKSFADAKILLKRAKSVFQNDPRVKVLEYILDEAEGKENVELLKDAIGLDPKYFKPYAYYINTLSPGNEMCDVLIKALDAARSFDEIFTIYRFTIVLNAQMDLMDEYPELFE